MTRQEYGMLIKEANEYEVSLSYFIRALLNEYSPFKMPPLPRGTRQGNSNAKKDKGSQTNS